MLTSTLWDALNNPPFFHPMFQRLLFERGRQTWDQIRSTIWLVTGMLVFVAVMILPVLFVLMLVLGPILYGVLNTLVYTALWSVDIAGTIARETSRRTYDLECMTPVGTLGINWIISTGRLHYNHGLYRSLNEVGAVLQLLVFMVLFALIGALVTPGIPEREQMLRVLAILIALMGFLYLDHIQSILCAVTLALIAGRQTRTVGDARLWTLICLLALQLAWYLLALILVMLVVPYLVDQLALFHIVFGVSLPFGVVGLLMLGRELLLRLLWSQVLLRTNADNRDLSLLQRYV